MSTHCDTCNTNAETCRACRVLPGSMRCNHHRTEGSVDRILRLAREAGYTPRGETAAARSLDAERHLGLTSVVVN